MPIQRTKMVHEHNFTQIPNDWVRDTRLSLKSIGLLSQLLSHSEGWSVTIGSLAKTNGCGRHIIRAAVQELEEAGYLKRKQLRGVSGTFAEVLWVTCEPSSPSSGYPTSEKPTSGKPTSENRTLKKNNLKKTNTKNTIRKGEHVHREGIDWPLLEDRHELV